MINSTRMREEPKMKKKIVSILLCLNLMVVGTACGNVAANRTETTNSTHTKDTEYVAETTEYVAETTEYVEETDQGNDESVFSKEGKKVLSKMTEYDSDGSIKTVYEYDEQGNRILYWRIEEPYGEQTARYEYEEQGNLINQLIYDNDNSVASSRYESEYDEQGNLIRYEGYLISDWGDVSILLEEYEYDDQGNRIEKRSCRPDNHEVTGWNKYEYDERGNLIKETICDYPDFGVNAWSEYEYDEQGDLIKEAYYSYEYEYGGEFGNDVIGIMYDAGAKELRTEYGYDEQGNLVKEESYSDSGSYNRTEYEYDERGNLIKEQDYLRYDSTAEERKMPDWKEYEYDEQGNLIKEMNCMSGGKNEILSWIEYEYFD